MGKVIRGLLGYPSERKMNMGSLNKVALIGNLGQAPEEIANGKGVKFSLATNESWKDKKGEKQERTTWHNIVVWDKLAKVCLDHLSVGQQIYLEGKIKNDTYERDGEKRYSTKIEAREVTFLGKKESSGGGESLPDFDDVPY
jgi:single-strand DNA-binding protein